MNERYAITTCALLLACAISNAQCPTTITIYQNDFESNNGGLISGGYGDWEWGFTPFQIQGTACTSTFTDPPGPYSGLKGWATVLADCYANSGDTSTLALTVDLSDPQLISAELTWAQWWEYFTNFDFGFVHVNGVQVYFNDSLGLSPAWETQTVDLTPFLGQSSVSVVFGLWATTVVNKTGWYLDDLSVTACTNSGVGVGTIEPIARVTVFPNPATDLIAISTSLRGPVNFILTDAAGRVLLHRRLQPLNGSVRLDLSGIAPGDYVLTVAGDNGRAMTRVTRL